MCGGPTQKFIFPSLFKLICIIRAFSSAPIRSRRVRAFKVVTFATRTKFSPVDLSVPNIKIEEKVGSFFFFVNELVLSAAKYLSTTSCGF